MTAHLILGSIDDTIVATMDTYCPVKAKAFIELHNLFEHDLELLTVVQGIMTIPFQKSAYGQMIDVHEYVMKRKENLEEDFFYGTTKDKIAELVAIYERGSGLKSGDIMYAKRMIHVNPYIIDAGDVCEYRRDVYENDVLHAVFWCAKVDFEFSVAVDEMNDAVSKDPWEAVGVEDATHLISEVRTAYTTNGYSYEITHRCQTLFRVGISVDDGRTLRYDTKEGLNSYGNWFKPVRLKRGE